jgi:hypothetical protein
VIAVLLQILDVPLSREEVWIILTRPEVRESGKLLRRDKLDWASVHDISREIALGLPQHPRRCGE